MRSLLHRQADAAIYILVGLLCWPVPLLNRLHVESMAVLALVAFFAAGAMAVRGFLAGGRIGAELKMRVGSLCIGLVAWFVPLLWAPNCGLLDGLAFFFLWPVLTVGFAVCLAWATSTVRHPYALLAAIGASLVVIAPVFDLGLHPQFYTYNHVFGGVLGPIYDEEIVWRRGIFWFRGLTVLWAAAAFAIGQIRRNHAPFRFLLLAAVILIGAAYAWSGPLGFNTHHRDLTDRLDGFASTEHVDVYYDQKALSGHDLQAVLDLHTYEVQRQSELLGIVPHERITSYVYPDPDTRVRLTGARLTSVAPVWLKRAQIHVIQSAAERLVPHELTHALARGFGMPVVRASPAVGLVEGLAVAMEPPAGRPSAEELIAAAGGAGSTVSERLEQSLSPLGFWTGRGGVSYTVSGAFVRWLLRAYGAAPLREAYRTGNIAEAFGRSVADLADAWRHTIDDRTWISLDAARQASERFGAPSLFERTCPHFIPRFERDLRAALQARRAGDRIAASWYAARALAARPDDARVIDGWARIKLDAGRQDTVRYRLAQLPDSLLSGTLLVMRADLAASAGDGDLAAAEYRRLRTRYGSTAQLSLAFREALAHVPEISGALLGSPDSVAGRLLRVDVPDSLLTVKAALLSAYAEPGQVPGLLTSLTGLPGHFSPMVRAQWPAVRLMRLADAAAACGTASGAAPLAQASAEAFHQLGDRTAAARMAYRSSMWLALSSQRSDDSSECVDR